MLKTDVAVIGGGIVGLATAYQFALRFPGRRVVVLEKEPDVSCHQSGHNSGVLHSGVYYRPGSLRALNCRRGRQAMEEFCRTEGISFEICGKVIVAVDESELPSLRNIYERGRANGVRCEWIGPERLKELEPQAAGIQAVHVPEAGIVDYRQVCVRLSQRISSGNGEVKTRSRVHALHRRESGVQIEFEGGELHAGYVINCAGLHSDRVTKMAGRRPGVRIVPFRGEYYRLRPEAQALCRNLIYPVPDVRYPFLGVHFTRVIDGSVECGPNAVLAFAREGYRKSDVSIPDILESLTYPGFLRLMVKYWRVGLDEMHRSFSKRAFVRALQRLMPAIRSEHLEPAPAGVRALALARDGKIVDDFTIEESERIINVTNAPSPAATASLNVGLLILEKLSRQMDGG